LLYSFNILLSILLDLIFGDPHWYPHPVCWIGWLCNWCEKLTRRILQNELIAGCITLGVVLLTTAGTTFSVLYVAGLWSPFCQNIFGIIMVYMAIAIRDLLKESRAVKYCLADDAPIEVCRKAVGRIVGRETKALDKAGICRACIETVAENFVDGIIAPLFYGILASFAAGNFGLSGIAWSGVGVFCYKAINTLDSMVGYKNPKYLYFGRCSAKLDDVVNFLPARFSGCCLVLAAWLLRLDSSAAWQIFLRDRLAHSSPNAGHTEAVVAGALNIRLGGPSFYSGVLVEKPYLGDDLRAVSEKDIALTNRLVLMGSAVTILVLLGLRHLWFVLPF